MFVIWMLLGGSVDQWNVTGELGLLGPFQSQHFGVLKSLKVVPLMEAEFRRDCVGDLGCVMHLGGYVKRGVHLNETKDFGQALGSVCLASPPPRESLCQIQ